MDTICVGAVSTTDRVNLTQGVRPYNTQLLQIWKRNLPGHVTVKPAHTIVSQECVCYCAAC